LLTVCEKGFGKQTDLNDYRSQKRGGIGLINIKTTERNGKVVALKTVNPNDDLMLISSRGILIRTGLDQLRDIGRNTQGVKLIRLDDGDKLVAVARVAKEEGKEESDMEETSEEPSVEIPEAVEPPEGSDTIEEAEEDVKDADNDIDNESNGAEEKE
jgi:DNA gyrase subunit A